MKDLAESCWRQGKIPASRALALLEVRNTDDLATACSGEVVRTSSFALSGPRPHYLSFKSFMLPMGRFADVMRVLCGESDFDVCK